jgi:hypothetical protein
MTEVEYSDYVPTTVTETRPVKPKQFAGEKGATATESITY